MIAKFGTVLLFMSVHFRMVALFEIFGRTYFLADCLSFPQKGLRLHCSPCLPSHHLVGLQAVC